MSSKEQVKIQAKTPVAYEMARIVQTSIRMPERRVDQPDISEQLEGASRLGHHLGGMSVSSGAPRAVQPKPLIDAPGDRYEREADRIATEVSGGQPHDLIETDGSRESAGKDLEHEPDHSTSEGQPLPLYIRAEFERKLGVNFSKVRIHTGKGAAALSQQMQAKAFTRGRDIYFNAGFYDPARNTGKTLLAHELTHVIQQGAVSPVSGGQNNLTASLSPVGSIIQRNGLTAAEKVQIETKAREDYQAKVQEANETIRRLQDSLTRTIDPGRKLAIKAEINDKQRTIKNTLSSFEKYRAAVDLDPSAETAAAATPAAFEQSATPAATGARAPQAARAQVTLGRMADLENRTANNIPPPLGGQSAVLQNTPGISWSPAVNRAFMMGGIGQRAEFELATPLSPGIRGLFERTQGSGGRVSGAQFDAKVHQLGGKDPSMWSTERGAPAVSADEVEQLLDAGYSYYQMPQWTPPVGSKSAGTPQREAQMMIPTQRPELLSEVKEAAALRTALPSLKEAGMVSQDKRWKDFLEKG